MYKLIVGLGNPGQKYSETRHNLGFMVIDQMAQAHSVKFQKSFKGEVGLFSWGDDKVILLRPLTYMNLSGESIIECLSFYKIEVKDILILHDELDLPYGVVAFKNGGGLAGHNGLKSTAQHLSTMDFKRLRLGIGRPVHQDVSDYVLSSFDKEEKKTLPDYIGKMAMILDEYLKNDFQSVLNKYNKKSLI